MQEKVEMPQKPRRTFIAKQKTDFSNYRSVTVAILKQSGKRISHVAQEMGLTERAL
ncbi:hypothetical protein L3556_13760 [Candidatus Synechococcus calcipolaris G9]|uniref:Transposase n=1 Tax=Candidatus Synechococcus calcipolaris G9 TaxID=1497997 RepID=A0ABT6F2A5_9SYNE|nr:hypothetical protein [Candidatus Synechococcus calcipolaris]MDG2991989.1 hypothetical protein [Candidatus Synechococcus calcipolaris G9]